MKKVIFSVGGSILFKEGDVNLQVVNDLKEFLEKTKGKYKVGIVVGGGKYARIYIDFAKKLGLPTLVQHAIGVELTQLHAKLLAYALNIEEFFCKTFEEAEVMFERKGYFVLGGVVPGYTTDWDAAVMAERVKADILVNITNVEGVYDKDPDVYPDAKFFEELDWKTFYKIFESEGIEFKPGMNFVFDPRAAKICENAAIPVFIIKYDKIKDLYDYLEGKKKVTGTLIK